MTPAPAPMPRPSLFQRWRAEAVPVILDATPVNGVWQVPAVTLDERRVGA